MNSAFLFAPRMLAAWLAAAVLLAAAAVGFGLFGSGRNIGSDAVGPSTFSRSAIGHAGIADVLQRVGVAVVKSRSESRGKLGPDGVLVVGEPNLGAQPQQLRLLLGANNVLLILPKRIGARSRAHPEWVERVTLVPEGGVTPVLGMAVPGAEVVRKDDAGSWSHNEIGVTPVIAAPVQLIKSPRLRPVVGSQDSMLVGEIRSNARRLWVLADPDVMENHGIDQAANAAFSVALINALRARNGNVVFDETIHGYVDQVGAPWLILFEFPFVLATLQGIVAVGLLLWATMGRFGAPIALPVALASGKYGLIQNTAKLFEFAGYQPIIVQRYVQAMVRDVARQLHGPGDMAQDAAVTWLDRIGAARGVDVTCAALLRRADELVRRREPGALAALARDTYRWKREIIDGRPGDSLRRRMDSRRSAQGGGRPG
jgi:hypothetical protein